MREGMQVGELAARFGLNPKTIRYYESVGLLPPAERTDSGYRRYTEGDVARLGFIRRAKLLGLALEEIRDLLSLASRGEQPCGQVFLLLDRKIDEVDRRIQELQTFRQELAQLRAVWSEGEGPLESGGASVCPIIEEQTIVAEHPRLAQILEPLARRRSG